MPRGHPDYNNQNFNVAVSTVDNADIVSAQRGFIRMDGRGRIALIDTFERGLSGWGTSAGSAFGPPYVTYQFPYVFTPPVGVRFPDLNTLNSAYMFRVLGKVQAGKTGIEMAINTAGPTADTYIYMYRTDAAGNRYQGLLRWVLADSTWSIVTPGGLVEVVDFSGKISPSYNWCGLKMVVDYNANKYVRVLIGDKEYDVSGYDLQSGVFGAEGDFRVDIQQAHSNLISNAFAIGYVIVTLDEP